MKQLANPPLTIEEAYEAIDEGIADMVIKWNKHKLPTKQQKAFKIWSKSIFNSVVPLLDDIGFD
jgi:hypothetical protein